MFVLSKQKTAYEMRISDWSSDVCSSDLSKFQDHDLELDLDLSDVMFVTTANSLNLPQPLLDRMEIIRLEGYTEDEKLEIAKRHLIPKQIEAHGLKDGEFALTDDGLRDQLGRPACRERGCQSVYISVVAEPLKKKKK